MPRPRGGDWLEDEMRKLREHGVTVLVSLLDREETAELELTREADLASSFGLIFHSLPIPDRDVPRNVNAFQHLVGQVHDHVSGGGSVAIHCRAGIGRSSILAASVLAQRGLPVGEAFNLLSACRGLQVPDTPAQRAWVEHFVATQSSRGSPSTDHRGISSG